MPMQMARILYLPQNLVLARLTSEDIWVIPKADILEKIVISYDINAMWLLTGLGNESIPNSDPGNPILATNETSIKTFFGQLDPYIQSKDAKIIQQAEEIGRLKEQIRQMNLEKGKHASDAYTSGNANVG